MKKTVLILAGPTAVGKTDLSLALAEKLNTSIISADSMQIYRGMDIGSAKPTPEELQRIPHHLIDVVSPDEPFTVSDFQRLAFSAIDQIHGEGKIPIVTGGTGLYINGLLYKMDFSVSGQNLEFREKMEQFAKDNGPEALHERLQRLDPAAAEAIHPNNIKRVIRALEITEHYGESKGDFRTGPEPNLDYTFILFCLTRERAQLYDRINRRVGIMMDAGLMDEIKSLMASGYSPALPSMQGIGYKELIEHLEGKATLDEALERIRQGSRNYAKRQLTWFRRYPQAHWLDMSDNRSTDSYIEEIQKVLHSIS